MISHMRCDYAIHHLVAYHVSFDNEICWTYCVRETYQVCSFAGKLKPSGSQRFRMIAAFADMSMLDVIIPGRSRGRNLHSAVVASQFRRDVYSHFQCRWKNIHHFQSLYL
jgi:hypothetical protein